MLSANCVFGSGFLFVVSTHWQHLTPPGFGMASNRQDAISLEAPLGAGFLERRKEVALEARMSVLTLEDIWFI